MGAVRGPYAGTLDEAQRFAAYAAGQNDAKASLAKEKAAAPFAQTAGDEAGLVYDGFVAEAVESGRQVADKNGGTRTYLTAETAARINAIAKDLGVRVRFADQADPKGEANGSISGNEIVLERDNHNPVMTIMGHEFTHRMQDLAPEEFRAFRDLAIQESAADEVEMTMALYAAHGYTLTYEQAMDEVAADYAGRLMNDGALMDRFIEANRGKRTLLQRMRDVFHALVSRLRGEDRRKAKTAEDRLTAALGTAYDAAVSQAARLREGAQSEAQSGAEGDVRYSFKGYDPESGKEIYEGNFPLGTPKAAKAERILGLIQNVWSKAPIDLVIKAPDGSSRTIQAQFDPTYDAHGENIRTDASKLMGGNRHGTASEQRVTLDLADDYYQIAQGAEYHYSKTETGKDSPTHQGVKEWHYFVNDILFQEYGSEETAPYRVTINVKERADGSFVYSFNAERQKERPSTRRTLHADVNQTGEAGEANAQPSKDTVPQSGGEVKGESGAETRFSIKNTSQQTLKEQLRNYYNGAMRSSDSFYFGETPSALTKAGLKEGPLAMTISDFKKSTKGKHNVPRRVMNRLQTLLDSPIMSFADGDRAVFLLDDIDGDGRPLVVATQSSVTMDDAQVNVIQSIYGLDHPAEWFRNQSEAGKRYTVYDKEKADSFLRSTAKYYGSQQESVSSSESSVPQPDGDVKGESGPETRFSLKDATITKSYHELLRENQELRERAERWRAQTRRTKEISTDKKAVAASAKELVEGYGATLDPGELTDRLQSLYDALTRGYDGKDEVGPTYAWEKAEAIARDIAESAVETVSLADEFPGLKEKLRGTQIILGREYDSDIRNEDFRRRYFGKLKLTSQGRTNVDAVYLELAQDCPGLFPGDITHPADQMERILDVADSLYTTTEQNPFSGDMEEAVVGITNEIVERFFELPQTRATFADRQDAKLDAAKAAGRRAVLRERDAKNRKIAKLKERDAQSRKNAVQRARDIRDRQLAKQKERDAHSRDMAVQRVRDIRDRQLAKQKEHDAQSRDNAVQRARDTRDRQIAKLKEHYAQSREKAAARNAERLDAKLSASRAAAQRAIQRERETRERQIKALKDRYAQRRKNAAGRRADQKARDRLLNIARRLQNKKLPEVNRTLLNQYIGELDTVAKSMTGATVAKLTELKEWYDDQRNTNPDFIADEHIEESLKRLSKRQIADLSAQEVADLTEVLLHIENEIRTQRKLIDSQERRDIYAAGEQVIRDVNASAGSRPTGLRGLMSDGVVTETLSPLRMARRISGYAPDSPLTQAVRELADGQRAMLDYQRRAEEQFAKYTGDKDFVRGFSGPDAQKIEIAGLGPDGPVTAVITPAMRASLYLHSLNDQNLRHIRDGGIKVPDWKLYHKGEIAKAYERGTIVKLTPSQVRAITAGMTQKERAFAMAAHRYFNQTSRESINAVSEKLKGYSIAKVENYFPIHTDSSFTRSDFESVKFDGTVEGMGFLKERVRAGNPIFLRDLGAELKQSYELHSRYVGLAIPVRNFNKLWNVETGRWVDGETGAEYNDGEGGGNDGLQRSFGSGLRGEGEGSGAGPGEAGAYSPVPGGIAEWAKDALIDAPGEGAGAAIKAARGYGVQAVVVSDAAPRPDGFQFCHVWVPPSLG